MISSPSILDRQTIHDLRRDRLRKIRDRLLCALEDAGRAMTPAELARRTGLGISAVSRNAKEWPAYFQVSTSFSCLIKKPRVDSIDRHHHLKTGA
jgi:hypothetical protein